MHASERDSGEYVLILLLSLGAGSLTGITLLHLVPEVWGHLGALNSIVLFALGYAALYAVGWIVHRACTHRNHNHDVACDHHDPLAGIAVNMTASCAHSFQDGLMLGASFLHGFPYGLAALYATILHEIPKKAGDFSFLRSRTTLHRTIGLLLFPVGVTLVTALTVYASGFGAEESEWLTGLLAGGFICYVQGHMLPDLLHRRALHHTPVFPLAVSFLAGFGGTSLMMKFMESHH